MSEFKLSTQSDNIFIINFSELEKRIDPNPYHIERLAEIERLQKLNCKKLKSLVMPSKSQTSTIGENDIYIGLENIKSNTGEYIKTEDKESISSANVFKSGQILFPKLRPYLNKVFLADFDGICSTEFHVFNAKNINPEFLAIYLRTSFVVNQTKHLMTGNTLPRLQTDDINNIPVPIIDDVLQQKIVNLYNQNFQKKQQKETQAKELLASIDDYLLNELGITLPEKDNSLENRIFTTSINQISSGRFDPDYNLIYYTNFIDQLSNKYITKNLKEISNEIFQGVGKNQVDFSDYILLKVKNIKRGNIIDYADIEFVFSVPQNKILQDNDIISPFIGEAIRQIKFSIFTKRDNKYTVDNNTGVIRINISEAIPNYICEVLNSIIGEIQLNKLIGGGGVPFLGTQSVKDIFIPIPLFEKQTEIANHITDLRRQAKQLELDADQIMQETKAEIETIILGE